MCKGPEVGLRLVLLQNTWLEHCEREGESRRHTCGDKCLEADVQGQVCVLDSFESLLVSLSRSAYTVRELRRRQWRPTQVRHGRLLRIRRAPAQVCVRRGGRLMPRARRPGRWFPPGNASCKLAGAACDHARVKSVWLSFFLDEATEGLARQGRRRRPSCDLNQGPLGQAGASPVPWGLPVTSGAEPQPSPPRQPARDVFREATTQHQTASQGYAFR